MYTHSIQTIAPISKKKGTGFSRARFVASLSTLLIFLPGPANAQAFFHIHICPELELINAIHPPAFTFADETFHRQHALLQGAVKTFTWSYENKLFTASYRNEFLMEVRTYTVDLDVYRASEGRHQIDPSDPATYTSVSIIEYEYTGQQLSKRIHYKQDSTGEPIRIESLLYDGVRLTEYSTAAVDQNDRNTFKYAYDRNGRLINITVLYNDQPHYSEHFGYDSKGQIKDFRSVEPGVGTNLTRYTWNAYHQIIQAESFVAGRYPMDKYEIEYVSHNSNQVREMRHFKMEDEYTLFARYRYEYDSYGNYLLTEEYNPLSQNDFSGLPQTTTHSFRYAYDNTGNWIERRVEFASRTTESVIVSSAWTERRTVTYE